MKVKSGMQTRRSIFRLVGGLPLLHAPVRGAVREVRQRVLSVPIANAEGAVALRYRGYSGYIEVDLGLGESLSLACIPAGEGIVGDVLNAWPDTGFETLPIRTIQFQPFLMGTFEITRGQWTRVASLPRVSRDLNLFFAGPSDPDAKRWPVEDGMTISQIEEFCARLRNYTGLEFRLPSEAEWEYACRAGTTSRYHFGDSFGSSVLTSEFISYLRFRPVGSLNTPNRFGLFDMHGGVFERCADWEHKSYLQAPQDARAWVTDGRESFRMIRGGFGASGGGSARRQSFPAEGSYTRLGFRVAASFDHGAVDPKLVAVLNAASFDSSTLAPFEVVSLFGEQIGPSEAQVGSLVDGRIPRSLGGVEVYFDEFSAPILFVSQSQINAVVPKGLTGRSSTLVVIKNRFQSSLYLELPIASARPGIFSIDGSGVGLAAALNQNGTVNSDLNPCKPNEIVSVYATGLGRRRSEVEDGQVAVEAAAVLSEVRAEIGGIEARVEYAGHAPGLVIGVDQVNVRVPPNVPRGRNDIILRVENSQSRAGVSLAVA